MFAKYSEKNDKTHDLIAYFRSTSETLSRRKFFAKREATKEALFPTRKPHILVSDGCKSNDPFIHELVIRERPNRVYSLSVCILQTN